MREKEHFWGFSRCCCRVCLNWFHIFYSAPFYPPTCVLMKRSRLSLLWSRVYYFVLPIHLLTSLHVVTLHTIQATRISDGAHLFLFVTTRLIPPSCANVKAALFIFSNFILFWRGRGYSRGLYGQFCQKTLGSLMTSCPRTCQGIQSLWILFLRERRGWE